MRKLKQFKIREFKAKELRERVNTVFTKEELELKEITISENFLLQNLFAYVNTDINKLKDETLVQAIIKINLEANESEAKESLKLGVIMNGHRYVPLVTSPSLMKAEEKDSKCDYLFIREDFKDLKKVLEDNISLSKLEEKENTELSINKDIIARTGLATSSAYKTNLKPRVAILDETEYSYIANYVAVKRNAFNDIEEIELDNYENKISAYDGCGLMTSSFANKIKEDLKAEQEVDFAIVRQYGMAIKGLVVKVDYMQYFEDNYVEDTESFKKEDGVFKVKDFWGAWVNLNETDMIITTSMAKWGKWWNSKEEYEQELAKDKYDKYRDTIDSLYVTKINKKEVKEYSLANYQLLCNLAITSSELEKLSEYTVDLLERCLDEKDYDTFRLLLNDILKDDKESICALDKTHAMLQCDKNLLTNSEIRRMRVNNIKKKIYEAGAGKIWVKGHYKVLCADPINFLEWIMTGKEPSQIEKGLGKREYYVSRETGRRTMSRNPLNSFSEIQNIELTQNKTLEKYLGNLTNEIIFLNQCDDTATLMSGADFDGDIAFVVDEDIIYNSVITTNRNFINLEDNKDDVVKLAYNDDNLYDCVLKGAGNQIGALSNLGIKICMKAQELTFKNTKTNEIKYYNDLKKEILDNVSNFSDNEEIVEKERELKELDLRIKEIRKNLNVSFMEVYNYQKNLISELELKYTNLFKEVEELKREFFKELFDKLIEEETIVRIDNLSNEEMKEILKKQFFNLRKYSYYALQLQMKAIDSPKTLKTVDKDDKEALESFGSMNPRFMYYSNKKMSTTKEEDEKAKNRTFACHSVFDINARKIVSDLYEKAYKLDNTSKNENRKYIDEVLQFNNEYVEKFASSSRVSNFLNTLKNRKNEIKFAFEKQEITEDEKTNRYKLLELQALKEAQRIESEEDKNFITHSLVAYKVSSAIIVKYFWNTLNSKLEEKYEIVTAYVQHKQGELEYLHKRYTKVNCTRKSKDLQAKFIKDKATKLEKLGKIGIRKSLTENDLTENDTIKILKENDRFVVYKNEEVLDVSFESTKIEEIFLHKELVVNKIKTTAKSSNIEFILIEEVA